MKETFQKPNRNKNEANHQSVKLQKYTITKFNGNYKDWLRFWNQYTVEVDNSNISNISKFNYILELVEGKPREDILGLPHSLDKYDKAKRILKDTYRKEIWVHIALIIDLEGTMVMHNTYKIKDVHDFNNKLPRKQLTNCKLLNCLCIHQWINLNQFVKYSHKTLTDGKNEDWSSLSKSCKNT